MGAEGRHDADVVLAYGGFRECLDDVLGASDGLMGFGEVVPAVGGILDGFAFVAAAVAAKLDGPAVR